MGGPVLTSTNGGTVFYIGNGPYAIGSHANLPTGAFSALDELTMHREGYKLGLEHVVNNPIEWERFCLESFSTYGRVTGLASRIVLNHHINLLHFP